MRASATSADPTPSADPRSASAGPLRSRRGAFALALVAALVAAAVLLPALGVHGLWAEGEAMVFDRTRAALGIALSDLVRAPWLPDALRTAAYQAIGAPEAIRLPGALATIGLVGLSTLIAAVRGVGTLAALIAGAFALAFPLTLAQGRLALGAPIAELFGAAAAITGYISLRVHGWRAVLAAITSAGLIALATACAGIITGALIPLLAIAVGRPTSPRPPVRRAVLGLWLVILAVTTLAAFLIAGQGDGYIPLLGAAKDLTLQDRPEMRGFTASLQELGFQIFPWLPLALVGILRPGKMRWPALWLLSGLGVHSLTSLVYGPSPLPLTVPAALCCTAGLIHLADPTTHRQLRRLALVLAIGGVIVIGKDAKRTPQAAAAILAPSMHPDRLPADTSGAEVILPRLSTLAILMVLIAGIAGGRRIAKPWIAPGVAAMILLYQASLLGHRLIPQISALRSLKAPFDQLTAWTAAGELPANIAIGRLSDPGLWVYGPAEENIEPATSRAALLTWLRRPEPSVALIRKSDLAGLFAEHRREGWPLFVLDAPPKLEHETLVRFDTYLEVVGWELHEPVTRGSAATVLLALRVLRPLPAGSQIDLRLQGGKLSRIGGGPQPFADGLYPTTLWRPGDFILHHHPLQVPVLEIVSGTHDVIVGVRQTVKKNLTISEPSEERGAYGVSVKGKKREFATIGEVTVW